MLEFNHHTPDIVTAADKLAAAMDRFTEALTKIGVVMEEALKQIGEAVQADTDAKNAVLTVIDRLASEIITRAGDPQAVIAAANAIKANAGELTDKALANTPAAPTA